MSHLRLLVSSLAALMLIANPIQAMEKEVNIKLNDINLEADTITIPSVVLEQLPEGTPSEIVLNELDITNIVLNAVVNAEEDDITASLTFASDVTETVEDGSSTTTAMQTTVTIDATATNNITDETVCTEGIIASSCVDISINNKVWNVNVLSTTTADANVVSDTTGALVVHVTEVTSSTDAPTSLTQTEPEPEPTSTHYMEGINSYSYAATTNTIDSETGLLETYHLAAAGEQLTHANSYDSAYTTELLISDITGDVEPDYYDDYLEVMGTLYDGSYMNGSNSLFEGNMVTDYVSPPTQQDTETVPRSQGGGTKTTSTTYSGITGDNISVYVDKTVSSSCSQSCIFQQDTKTESHVDINYIVTETTTYSNGSPTQQVSDNDSVIMDEAGLTTAISEDDGLKDDETVTEITATNALTLEHDSAEGTITQETTATVTVSGVGVINGGSTQVEVVATTNIDDTSELTDPFENTFVGTFICDTDSTGTYDAICGKQ